VTLAAGTRLGPYEVTSPIGKGGMGEVYRARDTKLDRDVAIKVLPEAFAKDEERLARFEREAKLLASLNHPNIASIYGLEESDGVTALVLELVEGPTLAERIAEGPIPVEDALPIARQITEALEAGHEAGVVHRDVKPANVKVREDGTVKVLDYGLAKALEGDVPGGADSELSQSPTLTRHGTQIGVILGTAAYMSPEQAKGKRVHKLTDIWAFGAVLFEMLTGKKMYSGETVSETLASVIKDDPDLSSLPSNCPGHVRALLCRCLTKDPKLRLQHIGEARIALSGVITESPPLESRPLAPLWQRALPWAATAALAAALVVSNMRPVPSLPVTRFVVALQADEVISRTTTAPLAFSRDGSHMVYSAQKGDDPPRLYLRSMNSLEDEGLLGTEGGDNPFFSPDGRWVGFFAGGEMKKVAITGGAAVTISRVGDSPLGASWGSDDRIIFGRSSPGLLRVSAEGGTPEVLTSSDASSDSFAISWPEILPEGQAVLFNSPVAIMAQRLDTGERKLLLQGGTFPHYLSTGHLIYSQAGTLMAVPFDLDRLEISGSPVPVIQGIRSGTRRGGPQFAVSRTGTLAYVPGTVEQLTSTLVWVDRQGVVEPLPAPPRQYDYPELSPDGQRVAVSIAEKARTALVETNIWVYDVARNGLTRLTFEGSRTVTPAWSPDAQWVAFTSNRDGPLNMFRQMANGSGGMERLNSNENQTPAASFSPDGQLLAFTESNPVTGRDIWVLNLADRETHLFLSTRYEETAPEFSPDGEWIAYSSNESGRREVYVRPYPGPGGKWQISTNGGHEPVWNPEGGELFYRSGSRMMAVPIDTESGFTAGTPLMLFEGPYLPTGFSYPNYDVTADGQRFLMLAPVASQSDGATQINVVLNWTEELKRLVPIEN